jgi:hypothetical protein
MVAMYPVVPSARLLGRIVAIAGAARAAHAFCVEILEQLQVKKHSGIRSNPAETPSMENPAKIDISETRSAASLDRRVSVASMMDWTDDR